MTILKVNYHTSYDNNGKLFYPVIHDDDYQDKLDSISRILSDSVVRINFWGTRELVSKDGVDIMPMVPLALDTVAHRLIHTAPVLQGCSTGARKEIVEKLKNFYATSDAQLKNSNCIKNIFSRIRELFTSSQLIEGHWSYGVRGSDRWAIENGY